MANFVKVASVPEIPLGQGKTIEAGGRKIALFNVDGKFFAIDNTCAHRGGPLGEGSLEEKTVTCPWHGWRYDVTTGVSEISPDVGVPSYPIKVEGQDIYVAV